MRSALVNFAGVGHEGSAPRLPASPCAKITARPARVVCVLSIQPTKPAGSVPVLSLAVGMKVLTRAAQDVCSSCPPSGSCAARQERLERAAGSSSAFRSASRSAGACPLTRVYRSASKNSLRSIKMETDCFSSARKESLAPETAGLERKAFISSPDLVPAGERAAELCGARTPRRDLHCSFPYVQWNQSKPVHGCSSLSHQIKANR